MLEKIIDPKAAQKLQDIDLLPSLFFIVNKEVLQESAFAKSDSQFYPLVCEVVADCERFDAMTTDVDLCLSRAYIQKFLYEADDDLPKIINSMEKVSEFVKYRSLDDILRLLEWEDNFAGVTKSLERNIQIFKTTTNINLLRISRRKADLQLIQRMLKNVVAGGFNYNV